MAETLTLSFGARDGRLLSLDAYTNSALWDSWTEAKQLRGESGALVLLEPIDDRVTLDVVPSYRFREGDSTLLIGLGAVASEHFQIGQDLFVGITNGELAEVILKNLHIE
jgi:hypothetical protein